MLHCLGQEGCQLSANQLKKLRLHSSLRLLMETSNSLEARIAAAEEAKLQVQEHHISGQSICYGRTYTLAHNRRTGVFVSQFVHNPISISIVLVNIFNRHQVRKALHEIDPIGVQKRKEAFRHTRRRKEYVVEGPNKVFSIDGHDKLSRFGFEIYGAIDTYSRYIVGCYVGISNGTAISVNKQYLRLVRSTLHVPKLIRFDKGI